MSLAADGAGSRKRPVAEQHAATSGDGLEAKVAALEEELGVAKATTQKRRVIMNLLAAGFIELAPPDNLQKGVWIRKLYQAAVSCAVGGTSAVTSEALTAVLDALGGQPMETEEDRRKALLRALAEGQAVAAPATVEPPMGGLSLLTRDELRCVWVHLSPIALRLTCKALREAIPQEDDWRWLKSTLRSMPRYWACAEAARGGRLQALGWARAMGVCRDPDACCAAAAVGRLEVLQWLHAQAPRCWDVTSLEAAARGGHLAVLQWIRAHAGGRYRVGPLCLAAAQGGQLEVLKWLCAQLRAQQEPPCHPAVLTWLSRHSRTWATCTCAAAARGGHLVTLQWLRAQDPPCPWDRHLCEAAAGRGDLETLQWLLAQDPPCPWNRDSCHDASSDLEMLQWIRAQPP